MTTAEAIEELNERIEIIERDYAGEMRECLEVMKMAIDALQKQELVKPTKCHIEPMYQGWHYQGQVRTKALVHYCPNCGQKLDWTED